MQHTRATRASGESAGRSSRVRVDPSCRATVAAPGGGLPSGARRNSDTMRTRALSDASACRGSCGVAGPGARESSGGTAAARSTRWSWPTEVWPEARQVDTTERVSTMWETGAVRGLGGVRLLPSERWQSPIVATSRTSPALLTRWVRAPSGWQGRHVAATSAATSTAGGDLSRLSGRPCGGSRVGDPPSSASRSRTHSSRTSTSDARTASSCVASRTAASAMISFERWKWRPRAETRPASVYVLPAPEAP
mmetsp:Transcript_36124/g.119007  ORF Transcript_36124/g.119007 Transcript_36124/m.119007 type:complete len:251 (+) Transcript_36124:220-972(+)